MRVAIIHDWLVGYAGGERVLEQLLAIWPDADLFTVVDTLVGDQRSFLQGKVATTTFIQHLPQVAARYRSYLPLMPLAIEQFDLSKYQLILSSSHAVAKGVIVGPDQLHVSYVHSPMRYAWDFQHQYLREAGLDSGAKSWLARSLLHRMRNWDYRTANGVDAFVANSAFIARRIWRVYRREASVIHPPVDTERFQLRGEKEDFYLAASRFVPYKRMATIVQAFAKMPDKRLLVIGDGPEFARVAKHATPNVTLLGYQSIEVLTSHMQRARAFVFAAEEDFGLMPLEAQACGTPVIAYGRGGSLETVRAEASDQRTGLFFSEQTPESIIGAVHRFEREHASFSPTRCRAHAEQFAAARFRREMRDLVEAAYDNFQRAVRSVPRRREGRPELPSEPRSPS